ncbi:hypothetical protein Tdes44962_MAKER08631 [Teratosphaeria destructans]|uniref:Uncharacterized protein n=1 Tax=Teratosphaeria destructans TaxID=418781 RepID=A0A9W7SW95_9PEZI|nr:hypothetical protein Tdes44962_MAKER08631 [Teratosphaeria destructans]
MNESHHFDKITHATFTSLLKQYPRHIPAHLQTLEQDRCLRIPHTTTHRAPSYLTKPDLTTLMDWKLAHGTPRPTLPKLIRSNPAETVTTITREALQTLPPDPVHDPTSLRRSLDHLCALRGVGPATASLLLSVADTTRFPFFSDELYRWAHYADPAGTTRATAGKGWERKIEYSMRAYLSLYERVEAFRRRMREDEGEEVGALDVEKVGYVLGRTGGKGVVEAKQPGQDAAGKRGGRKRKAVEPLAAREADEAPTDDAVAERESLPRKRGRKQTAKA